MSLADKDLFQGTAEYYAKYRMDYPREMLDRILNFYQVDGRGRLLDLGCGTGQLAIPFHPYFKEVVGIDISAEMINEARRMSREHNAENTCYMTMESEKIGQELGLFEMIVCGNAFHWMDQALVLNRAYEVLKPSGGMAILAGGSVWTGKRDWQKETLGIIKKWLGEKRKAGKGEFLPKNKSFEETIQESKLSLMKTGRYQFAHQWNIESLLGYLYSTSYCNKGLLGDKIDAFELDVRATLLRLNPDDCFVEDVEINYFFLKK